ncbi:hypothetical protein [Desulfovibrio sp.]|uniref:hypothetical protein n=1 Tax=Desulfovibrio sp. TaxID=885 RepID=UPI0035B1C45A
MFFSVFLIYTLFFMLGAQNRAHCKGRQIVKGEKEILRLQAEYPEGVICTVFFLKHADLKENPESFESLHLGCGNFGKPLWRQGAQRKNPGQRPGFLFVLDAEWLTVMLIAQNTSMPSL